jgi:2-dehydro-3-deoxyphosphogluconate aldolase / (4S)-4-hydroxy-2-oxoglutarate aldolase
MNLGIHTMKREETRRLIQEIGIVPVIRATSSREARLAAEAVTKGGIPIVEITLTVPGAVQVIAELVKTMPEVLVGAGTVLNKDLARQCVEAGAQFLVTPGFEKNCVETAHKFDLPIMAGALTPTEVMAAWEAGVDFVKIFPCGNVGGPGYIKALRGPLPQVPLVPTGGVNLENAADYIRAGAVALGVGGELIPKEALQEEKLKLITELAKLYTEVIKNVRKQSHKTA